MIAYFGGNSITKKFYESAGPDGTTVKKDFTAETWFKAYTMQKPDPKKGG